MKVIAVRFLSWEGRMEACFKPSMEIGIVSNGGWDVSSSAPRSWRVISPMYVAIDRDTRELLPDPR